MILTCLTCFPTFGTSSAFITQIAEVTITSSLVLDLLVAQSVPLVGIKIWPGVLLLDHMIKLMRMRNVLMVSSIRMAMFKETLRFVTTP